MMKTFRKEKITIWLLAAVLLALSAFQAFGQDSAKTKCPCDSSFVWLVKYRIERQLDWNATFRSELRTHDERTAILESRIDSLVLKVLLLSEASVRSETLTKKSEPHTIRKKSEPSTIRK